MKAPPGGTSQYHYPIQRFVQRNMGAPDGAGDPRAPGFQRRSQKLPLKLYQQPSAQLQSKISKFNAAHDRPSGRLPGTGVYAGPQGIPYMPPRPMQS